MNETLYTVEHLTFTR